MGAKAFMKVCNRDQWRKKNLYFLPISSLLDPDMDATQIFVLSGPPLPYGVVARLRDDKLVVLEGLQSSLLPRSAQQNNLPLL